MTRPERAQPVRLSIDGLGEVNARVERAGDDRLAVVLGVELDLPVEALAQRHAHVEFATERGLYRMTGDVVQRSRSGVVELSIAEEERIQRRQDVRVHVVRPVSVLAGEKSAGADGTTVDVSGGGLLIAGPAGLGVGEHLAFALGLDEGAVGGRGEVVRRTPEGHLGVRRTTVPRTPEGHLGVRIDHISRRERELLVRFVFASERRLRQRGLA